MDATSFQETADTFFRLALFVLSLLMFVLTRLAAKELLNAADLRSQLFMVFIVAIVFASSLGAGVTCLCMAIFGGF